MTIVRPALKKKGDVMRNGAKRLANLEKRVADLEKNQPHKVNPSDLGRRVVEAFHQALKSQAQTKLQP